MHFLAVSVYPNKFCENARLRGVGLWRDKGLEIYTPLPQMMEKDTFVTETRFKPISIFHISVSRLSLSVMTRFTESLPVGLVPKGLGLLDGE